MSEWRECRLEQVVQLKRGFDLATRDRRPGPFPVVGSAGISGWHDEGPIPGPALVLGRAGSSMGVASYCEAERFWPLNTSLFVEDFKGNDPRFLFHLFQLTDLTGYNSGSAQPMLNRNYIRDVVFLMPGIEEQRAISGVLKALDDKIAVNDRIVTAIEELSAAIFRNSFTEALTFLTRGDELPYEWTADVMGGVCSVLETGRRPKGGVSGYADGVPSIGAESITRLGEFDFAKVKYVPEEFFAGMRQGIIEDYDILLYKDGGRPGNFEPHVSMFGRGFPFERMCINEHVYRIRLANPLSQAYGYFWLTSEPVMTEMRSRGTGVAIPGLNSSAVRELPVAYPAVDRLTRFNETVLPMIDRALSAASESRGLGQLRDTLLPKLMSGAIRVRDAEKVVEDVT